MALENFTTYTEQDVSGYITETPTKVTGTAVKANEDILLYKDYTANYFDGLCVAFELYVENMGANPYGSGGIGITNTLQDIIGLVNTDIACTINDQAGPARINLWRGNPDIDGAVDYYVASVATPYYCLLRRLAGNDTATVEIYSDSERLTLLDTLSVSGYSTTKWRYSMGFINRNTGHDTRLFTGYVQNMDLAYTKIKTINGLAKASIKTVNGLVIANVKSINGLI